MWHMTGFGFCAASAVVQLGHMFWCLRKRQFGKADQHEVLAHLWAIAAIIIGSLQ
jgi:hypothetical protein